MAPALQFLRLGAALAVGGQLLDVPKYRLNQLRGSL